ncbi:MAG: NADH:ubiquinone reductase (Na(+)-transporting) subunit C [Crocinitomicaceae bacterium]|nr:NADH:ubiquinone reductase (Na(+)-transporting) subunit C [Crocinitomicaceae bacterium]|tara:strand:+ start:1729 stop:2445 length:717 start_codon:yes stop_codon:yes gene_type:complete
MALDKNSNGYTFGFAIVMVIVVGAVLSIAAIQLKPFQDKNISQEKMQNILYSISVECSRDEAPDLFEKYVTEQVVINSKGEPIEGVKAFDVDVQKQYKELKAKAISPEAVEYPLFVCNKDGETIYVVPMVGTGLWGPVWGFISLKSDLNTIFGATFDHKTETPGLGAEIKENSFGNQFKDDVVYTDGKVTIKVIKGGGGADDPSGVDGITGGTITSVGVEEMIQRTFEVYKPYFETIK